MKTDKAYNPAPLSDSVSGPYQFTVWTKDGHEFSIHKDQESADRSAAQVGGIVKPYIEHLSTYWNQAGTKYDH